MARDLAALRETLRPLGPVMAAQILVLCLDEGDEDDEDDEDEDEDDEEGQKVFSI